MNPVDDSTIKTYRNYFGVGLIIACLWGSLYAQKEETIIEYQKILKERITSIIKAFDPQAHVFVNIESKKITAKLPMTPFTVNQLDLSDNEGKLQIKSIEVNILSAKNDLPIKIREIVQELAAEFEVQPIINFRTLPQELIKVEKEKLGETVKLPNWFQWAEEYFQKDNSVPFHQVLIGLGISGLLILLTFIWALSSWVVIRGLSRSMHNDVGNLVSAIEQASGGGMGQAQIGDVDMPGEATRGLSPVGGEESVVKSLPYNSITALLTDCYWSQQDQYAAYIWMQISISMKEKLMDEMPFLMNYVSYLTAFEGVSLGHEQDPYYLNPLKIGHIDNNTLTELTLGNPVLIKKLPPIRLNFLNLKISQRIALTQQANEGDISEIPNFEQIEESEHRQIKKREMYKIKSFEEEMEVLHATYKKENALDIVSSVVSLGWLTMLPTERATDILHNYNARQLASAWIGPDEILDKLGTYMNKDKLDLVLSYAQRMSPNREGQVFRMLHEAAVSYIKQDMDSCTISLETSGEIAEEHQGDSEYDQVAEDHQDDSDQDQVAEELRDDSEQDQVDEEHRDDSEQDQVDEEHRDDSDQDQIGEEYKDVA